MDVVEAMLRHWAEEPPVGLLFAHFVGYKAPATADQSDSGKRAAADELRAMFPTGTIK